MIERGNILFGSMTNGEFALFGKRGMFIMLKLSTTTNKKKRIPPVHPGEILLLEFLEPMGLSQNRLALDIGVPPRRINEIVLQKRGITADTALRLAKYFDMTPQFWLGLQMDYELDLEIDRMTPILKSLGKYKKAA